VALVCDLISLILRFLEGDLTLRFGLKVLVIALIAGGAFGYYLSDLRRDERTSPLPDPAAGSEVRSGRAYWLGACHLGYRSILRRQSRPKPPPGTGLPACAGLERHFQQSRAILCRQRQTADFTERLRCQPGDVH